MVEMSIWQIDRRMLEIGDRAEDPETGEILDEELYAELEALEMARPEKIENLALWIKDLQAFAADLKEEKLALAKRQGQVEAKAEKLRGWLMQFLHGEKPKSAKYQVRYNTTQAAVVTDEQAAIDWLWDNGYEEAVKVDTSVKKDALKKILKGGADVPGACLEERVSMTVK